MRTTETIMVEQTITTYGCDFCNFTTKENRGCCGSAPVMSCDICKKDCCREHRYAFFEHDGDYCDWRVCSDCFPLANVAWEIALAYATRYENIREAAEKHLQEIKNGDWDNDDLYGPSIKNPISLEDHCEILRKQREAFEKKRSDLYETI